jgi:hypothetical protein
MQHMPYERMEPGDVPDDTASASRPEEEGAPRRKDPDEREEPRRTGPVQEPGRTPGSAEGPEHEERRTPSGIEPGPTPGSAEGEDTPD